MGRGLPWRTAACACAVWLAACGTPPLTGGDGGDASTDAHAPEMGGTDAGDAGGMDLGGTDADAGDVDGGTCVPAACPWGCIGPVCDKPVRVSVGSGHGCAVTTSGRVYCWGANPNSELATMMSTVEVLPVRAAGISDAYDVAVGTHFTCIRHGGGEVACVGYDASGSIGNGPPLAEVHSFVETLGPVVGETLSTTYLVVCASLAAPGQVQCWGDDHAGQVGDGVTGVGRAVDGPSTVLRNPATSEALSDAYQVACEADACCAALGSGAVECWGSNTSGELGDGTMVTRTGTVRVMGITTNVMKLVPASNRMFAVLTDNTVLVWGAGSSTPTGLAASDVMDVGAGRNHVCLLSTSGRVTCTGENTSGECGTGVVTAMPVVTPFDVGLTGVTQISSSWSTTCAVTDIGELWCWGENGSGQTGVGDAALADVPMPALVTP